MKLSDLLPSEGITYTVSPEHLTILGVSDHTDQIREGDLFIVHRGANTDPLSLLNIIEQKGAAALLLEAGTPPPRETSLPCFYAKDLALAEAFVWERIFGDPAGAMRLFAVTGTNGKTSTSLILAHIFNRAGIPCGYIGTLGAKLDHEVVDTGTPTMTTPPAHALYRTLYQLRRLGAQAVVLEVSSHALAQRRVARLHFEAALFTNLGEDHLDFHKTKEAYFAAKRTLFAQAKLALINADDDHGARLLEELSIPKYSVAAIENADYTITELHENGAESTEYICRAPEGDLLIQYPLFGAFNVYNTLLAIACALQCGVCHEEVRQGLLSLEKPKGRLEVLPLDTPFSIVIDYAHTPDAMRCAIKAVRRITHGRLFVLFGAGGEREKEKRPLMGAVAEELADYVILTSDNPRKEAQDLIFQDILYGMKLKNKHTVITDRKDAIEYALAHLQENDTLLLLGKGHEEYLLLGEKTISFSERQIIYDYLRKKEST